MATQVDTRRGSGPAATPPDQESGARAFEIDLRIRDNVAKSNKAMWELARDLYDFHEMGGWAHVGADTLEEYLGDPEVSISRSQFFRLTKVWRDLVVVKEVAPARLQEIEPTKVHEVVPAIVRGDAKVDKALDDAKGLSKSDLREKYRPSKKADPGDPPIDLDPPIDSKREPDLSEGGLNAAATALEGAKVKTLMQRRDAARVAVSAYLAAIGRA